MAYRRRRTHKSGFTSYCQKQLSSIKKAKKAGSRSKAALRYQKCLSKHNVKTGLKAKRTKI